MTRPAGWTGTGVPAQAIVVGAGLAGLTAALQLADLGSAVTVLEARPRLGGATASFDRDGCTLDTGQHVFLGCCTAYRALLRRLGVEQQTVLQPRLDVPVLFGAGSAVRVARLRRSGFPLPPPAHLAGGLLGYRALPLPERLRAAGVALALGRLDPSDPAIDAQTFGGWLARHGQGPRSIAALWGLLTVATLNTEPDRASLALAAKVVQTGLLATRDGADIGVASVPLGELHAAAARAALMQRGAAILTGTRARWLRPQAGRWQVGVDGAELTADAVILAVPAPRAAELAPPAAQLDLPALARLGSTPIVNVHVFYDRRVLDHPFVAALDSPVQWVFDRTAAAGVSSGQYLVISLSAASGWLAQPTARLAQVFVAELARLLPAARGAQVRQVLVTREPHATFDQAAGQAAFRPGPRTALPGLVLAGAWTRTGWPATMEGAVRSGLTAVDALRSAHPAAGEAQIAGVAA
ncbi:MAG TPA: hydroxysqualene dehydroxylase HpnE [Mycobacteriales bacterium]|jgi:squalene-associated FAD-dependent desaturase|nr:hydroxysqualene dehydroxylase HpnE [Mycobacteriales bacterium]